MEEEQARLVAKEQENHITVSTMRITHKKEEANLQEEVEAAQEEHPQAVVEAED